VPEYVALIGSAQLPRLLGLRVWKPTYTSLYVIECHERNVDLCTAVDEVYMYEITSTSF
jgi:hypothetical protein